MKYEPANADGLKPWVVTRREWDRTTDSIAYAETAAKAKYAAIGRQRWVTVTVRRATPADMDRLR